jgi:hypothetical protein
MENDLEQVETTWRETQQRAEKDTALNPGLWRATDSGHHEGLQRYASLKRHQEQLAQYILDYDPPVVKGEITLSVANEARKLLECGMHLTYLDYWRVGKWKLVHGFTCKMHLLCACCAMRRHAVMAKAYEQRIRYLLQANPSLVPVLITKTVKNGPSLSERFAHISSSHRQLIKRRNDSLRGKSLRLRNLSVMRHVHGGAGAYEIKRGKGSGGWHPHMHEIALLDANAFEFVEQERKGKMVSVPLEFESQLTKEWWQITGDSYIVDVRRIYADEQGQGKDELFLGVCESFKYALKLNEFSFDDQLHAYVTLRRGRLVYNYGSLYGLEVPDDSADSIEDELALEPYLVVIYKYFSGSYDLADVRQPTEKDKKEYRPFTSEERQKYREKKKASAIRSRLKRKMRPLEDALRLEALEIKRKRRS